MSHQTQLIPISLTIIRRPSRTKALMFSLQVGPVQALGVARPLLALLLHQEDAEIPPHLWTRVELPPQPTRISIG